MTVVTADGPSSGAVDPARGRRRAAIVIPVVVVVLVVVGALAGSGDDAGVGPSLSPGSAAPDGTLALTVLLRQVGADVRTGAVIGDADVVLVLRDRLGDDVRDELAAYAAAGGTLVVADPGSELSAPVASDVAGPLDPGRCDLAAVADVDRLTVADDGLGALEAPARYRVDGEATSCFGDGGQAYIVDEPRGAGRIVSVGGPHPFTNRLLGTDDAAVLAVRLLAPAPGTGVLFLEAEALAQGETGLADLVPARVAQAIVQLGVAFGLYCLWRGRRLGKPVTEPQVVAVAGSQLVRAVGELHQRARSWEPAAAELRDQARRVLAQRFGLPRRVPVATLAAVVAERTTLDASRVRAALEGTPIGDERALVGLAAELDALCREGADEP